jgi:hypothetical protein
MIMDAPLLCIHNFPLINSRLIYNFPLIMDAPLYL